MATENKNIQRRQASDALVLLGGLIARQWGLLKDASGSYTVSGDNVGGAPRNTGSIFAKNDAGELHEFLEKKVILDAIDQAISDYNAQVEAGSIFVPINGNATVNDTKTFAGLRQLLENQDIDYSVLPSGAWFLGVNCYNDSGTVKSFDVGECSYMLLESDGPFKTYAGFASAEDEAVSFTEQFSTSNVVKITVAQTITGEKDFTGGLKKSGATVPSQTGLVNGNIVVSDSNQNLVDSGKTVNDFTETQSFTSGNLAQFDTNGDLVDSGEQVGDLAVDSEVVHLSGAETITGSKNFTGGLQKSGADVPSQTGLANGELVEADASQNLVTTGKAKENIAFKNEENTFSEKQTFANSACFGENEFNAKPLDFKKAGEVGAQFEQVRRIVEITEGSNIGRLIVGTGTSTGDGLVHYSDDRGKTWATSTGTPSFIRCDGLLYVSGDVVLAGFKGGSIGAKVLYRSTDGGASFSVLDNFVPTGGDNVSGMGKNSSGRVFIGAGGASNSAQVQYSDNILDATPTFSNSAGVVSTDTIVYSLFVDPDTDYIYIGTLSPTVASIQVSTDDGLNFSNVTSTTITEAFVIDINKNPKTGTFYATCGTTQGKLLQSTDGLVWTTKYTGSEDGYLSLYSIAFSKCGRAFIGTDNADILESSDDFTTKTPVEIDASLESVRALMVSSRYDLLVGSGSDTGDGDIWASQIYNRAIIDNKKIDLNRRDYGAVQALPTDAVCGDECFHVEDNEPHYYNGTEWLPTHLGEQTFLYLDWDGTASINHGAQNVWQVVKFWDANDFNQVTYNGNTGVDAGSYNFDLTHFGFWFRALLNLSISASTGSHTVEFAIETKLDSEQWPEETGRAIGDNIVAGSIKPATIDSAGGSITQVTRARITEKMQIRVITRCTSGANKITNFSYGIKEITRVS